jgi:hypothetical protein
VAVVGEILAVFGWNGKSLFSNFANFWVTPQIIFRVGPRQVFFIWSVVFIKCLMQ